MRFPTLALATVALGSVSGPVCLAGSLLALAAGGAAILNRLLNGKAAHCPDCAGPLVPGKCSEGPCLTCPRCGGCFDEQARRTIVAVQELATARPAKAGDPCAYCDGELVKGTDADTGELALVCLDCDAGEAPQESADEIEDPRKVAELRNLLESTKEARAAEAAPAVVLEHTGPVPVTYTAPPADTITGAPAPAEDLAKASEPDEEGQK